MKVPSIPVLFSLWTGAMVVVVGETIQWPQFRGEGGRGVAARQSIRPDFGPDTGVRWKVAAPDGQSSPVVWEDRIFLTGHEGTTLRMICLRRSDGKVLWQVEREIAAIPTYEHVAGDPANSTPATDGERVVFYFDDHGILVTDLDGRVQWEKQMPSTGNEYSYGASPVLDAGRIYLNRDGGVDSSLLCLDAATGRELWRTDRTGRIMSFCTPHLVDHDGKRQVLAGGTGRLTGYDAASGRELWSAGGLPIFICPSPVADGGRVFFGGWTTAHVGGQSRIDSLFHADSGVTPAAMKDPAAFFKQFDADADGKLRPAEFPESRARDAFNFIDKDRDGFVSMAEWAPAYTQAGTAPGRNVLLGIRLGGEGDVTSSHVQWELTKGLPYVASPLIFQDRLYLVATGGFMTCVDPASGKALYEKERLGVGGEYYASPVGIGNQILVCAQRGTVFLVRAGDTLAIDHRTDLGETISATPAVADNTLYLRSEHHLWAFGR